MDDPLEMVEQKYHLFVLAGYAVVVAIIVRCSMRPCWNTWCYG